MKTCSPTYLPTSLRNFLLSNSLLITIGFASQAQAQVPLPGGFSEQNNSAPIQTQQMQQPKVTAPIPGNMPNQNPQMSAYQQLPLNHLDAQARIESLKQTIATARPTKDLQESVYQLCEWLTDMANAHYKLSSVFAKHEATKGQADLERRQATKFSQLKNQAQLLKAELLIRQNRYPEALSPLVDIVSNEPRSATGQQAYKRLQQIGFSEEVQPEEPKATASEAATQSAQNQISIENKASATISRAGTVSVEGYVGSPNSATKPKTSVLTQPAKAPAPAPNQSLPNQILSPR